MKADVFRTYRRPTVMKNALGSQGMSKLKLDDMRVAFLKQGRELQESSFIEVTLKYIVHVDIGRFMAPGR